MSSKVLKAIPKVFSLRGNSYGHYVVVGGASQMMKDAWAGVGVRMNGAIIKVGEQAEQHKKKAPVNVKKEAA